MLPLIDAHPAAPFLDWLEGAGLKLERRGKPPSGVIPALPPRSRLEDLLRRLGKERTDRLISEIRALVRDYERYAEATGDAEILVKAACHFSGRLRRRHPREALRLVRLAHRWQPSNPYTWTQWAAALEALGEDERAEVVYWEAVRRFPENAVARVALADLLVKTERFADAEALLRETMDRFRDNEVSRNALADLLAKTERFADAEALLRETMDRFRDDEFSRNALADLLTRSDRLDEAEYLYRETMAQFRRDRVAPHALAFLLLRRNRIAEAEDLYWQIRSRFAEDRYTRKLAEEIARLQEGWRGEMENAWRTEEESPKRVPASEKLPAFEEDNKRETSLGRVEVKGTPAETGHPQYAEQSVGPGMVVAEPVSEYGAPDETTLDLDPRLRHNAEVGRADLMLRSGVNGSKRQDALVHVEEILDRDPDHIYPRLILGLHDTDWCRRLVAETEAFHSAYPLRFLAARETGSHARWDRLLSDFGEHRPWTLLGRLVAGNGDADPADASRLATWVAGGNGSRRGFEAFTAERLERWLGESPGDADPTELLRRLTAHRGEIEVLVGDALRRAADEGS
jgi:Flp pilus assembly protein TadD